MPRTDLGAAKATLTVSGAGAGVWVSMCDIIVARKTRLIRRTQLLKEVRQWEKNRKQPLQEGVGKEEGGGVKASTQ